MKEPYPYRCDGEGCEQRKGPANRWWLVESVPGAFLVKPWDESEADENDTRHSCSEACTSKMLSSWLAQAQPKPVENRKRRDEVEA